MRIESRSRRGIVWRSRGIASLVLLAALGAAPADEYDGVLPVSLDQPRVNISLRRQPRGQPLTGKADDGAATPDIEAFLDTGASGILLSSNTASSLGVKRERAGRDEVRFEDIGVGGGDKFAVSERLYVAVTDSTHATRTGVGPVRTEVGPLGGGIMDLLVRQVVGDLDVVGMPAIYGRVIVLDPTKVNQGADKIRTIVYDGNRDRAAVPRSRLHVRLSFANFANYTKTIPANGPSPDMAGNPFIGPSPLGAVGPDRTPPIVVTHHGKQSAGSWLLDTGAATSMISSRQAKAVGITYVPATEGTIAPQLAGVPADQQFTMTIGGIGGSKKAVGFYLDRLTLQTAEGRPITFLHAPVLVADITAKNVGNGSSITLDGIFGMNYLVSSAKLSDGALPDIERIAPGPFKLIVFDQPKATLGLE